MASPPPPWGCPSPEKKFRTDYQELAETVAQMHTTVGKKMAPYLCECGQWHLRNETKRARMRRNSRRNKKARDARLRKLAPVLHIAEHADWLEFA